MNDRIDAIISEVRKRWSYIDIDSFYEDLPPSPAHDPREEWRDLTRDFLRAIEVVDRRRRVEQATAAPGELR